MLLTVQTARCGDQSLLNGLMIETWHYLGFGRRLKLWIKACSMA